MASGSATRSPLKGEVEEWKATWLENRIRSPYRGEELFRLGDSARLEIVSGMPFRGFSWPTVRVRHLFPLLACDWPSCLRPHSGRDHLPEEELKEDIGLCDEVTVTGIAETGRSCDQVTVAAATKWL